MKRLSRRRLDCFDNGKNGGVKSGVFRRRLFLAGVSFGFIFVLFSNAVFAETISNNNSKGTPRSDPNHTSYEYRSVSGETIRGMRPPKPLNLPQDVQYPAGFLSETTPHESPTVSPPARPEPEPESTTEPKPTNEPDRLANDLPDDDEPNTEPLKAKPAANAVMISFLSALITLGLFFFFDFRYRRWLNDVLARNSRLLAPDAISSDFAGLVYSTAPDAFSPFDLNEGDLLDPIDGRSSLFSSNDSTLDELEPTANRAAFDLLEASFDGYSPSAPLIPYASPTDSYSSPPDWNASFLRPDDSPSLADRFDGYRVG